MAKAAHVGDKHKQLIKDTLQVLEMRRDVWAWSNNSGAMKIGDRFVRFGKKGSADIIGFTSDGKFFAAEGKTGKAVLSPAQKEFKAAVEAYGGRYFLIRDSWVELIKQLDNLNLAKVKNGDKYLNRAL